MPLQLLVPRLDPGGFLDGGHLAVELVDVRETLGAAGLRGGDLLLRRYPSSAKPPWEETMGRGGQIDR